MSVQEVAPTYGMEEFEAEFRDRDTSALELAHTLLDLYGVESPDWGQQGLATASGTDNTKGCDLDGE